MNTIASSENQKDSDLLSDRGSFGIQETSKKRLNESLEKENPSIIVSTLFTDGSNEFDIYFRESSTQTFLQNIECTGFRDEEDEDLPPKLFTVSVSDEEESCTLDLLVQAITISPRKWQQLQSHGMVVTRLYPVNTKLVLAIPSRFKMSDTEFRRWGMEAFGFIR